MPDPRERAFHAPHYWRYESSGVLAPVVEAYILRQDLTPLQIATMRAYLSQWIDSPVWDGAVAPELRKSVREIQTRDQLDAWIDAAVEEGIDPL